MLTYDIVVTDHFRRLDSFLRNHLHRAPYSYLKKLVKSAVTVNGLPAAADLLLKTGDRVALKETARTLELLSEGRPPIDILYEDDRILILNKPPGLSMHRTAEEDEPNLVDTAEAFLREEAVESSLRPINRLDKGTSGAVILGRTSRSAGMYGRQVKEKGLGKVYLAFVEGNPPPSAEIDLALDGKEAITRYQTIAEKSRFSLLAVFPVTGRTHQIRRHLQSIGFPVLGDRRYGGSDIPGYPGHLLHSLRTTFTEPEINQTITIYAPLPAPFLALLRTRLGDDLTTLLHDISTLS